MTLSAPLTRVMQKMEKEMNEEREPDLVLVRTPCPLCGAETEKAAQLKCAPRVSCPASDLTDAEGYIVEATAESSKAWRDWAEKS